MTEHIRESSKGSVLYELRRQDRLELGRRYGDVAGVVAAIILWVLMVMVAMGVA